MHRPGRSSTSSIRAVLLCAALLLVGAGAAGANVSALDFASASQQYVTFGAAPDMGQATFTLELWFRRDAAGTTASSGSGGVSAVPLFCKGRGEADGNNRDCNYFFGIRPTDNVLVADFEDMASGLNHPVAGTTPIQTGVWTHAAATYDGVTWRLYLNGILDGQSTANATPRYDSIQHASLATALTSTGAAQGYFDGVLDEVRLWDHARSESEISGTMYDEIEAADGLAGRWGLNENGGATAGNSIAGGSAGTLTHGPAWVPGFPVATAPPEAPTDLSATATSPVSVEVVWTDNAGDEASFLVERSTTGAGGAFETLATLPADTELYTDNAVTGGSEYCYRVSAANAAGSSGYSNIDCDTTPTEGNIALDFDGSADYATFGSTSTLGLAEFTLECWFKREGTGVGANTGAGGFVGIPLVTKGRGESDGSNVDMNYFLGIRTSDNVIGADFEDMATGLNHPVFGATAVTQNTWHHVAATYDGTTWRLYLDGNLDAEVTANATPRYDSIQHAGLATAMNSAGAYEGGLAGVLDEVRIWDHARSLVEIQTTINTEIEGAAPGLVGRWGLDEGAGTIISSSAGVPVDGLLIGNGLTWVAGSPFDILFSVPAAPGDLEASGSVHGRIVLTWADNSGNEAAFEIERSLDGPGGPFALLAETGPNVTAYGDADVTAGAEYCYRVRAVNLQGASDYSNTACAETGEEGQFALDLGGADTYVTFGPAPALGRAEFTLECWFRREGAGVAAGTGSGGFSGIPLVTKGRGESDGSNVDMNYFLGIRASDNVIGADFEDMASGLNHPVFGTTPITMNEWHHAAATFDGDVWRLYLDGNLEAEQPTGATPRYDSIQHAALGSALNSSGAHEGFFEGVLDEARVWNHARSLAEIRAAANEELPGAHTGLIARWGLNSGSGTGVFDTAGLLVDGTVVGGSYSWITPGAPFGLVFNDPPLAPVLIQPADGAQHVESSPTLAVAVEDPDMDEMTVTFHGRPVNPSTGENFTLVILPDTQFYSQTYHDIFHLQTQWIVDNREARNIVYVGHEGDIVQNGDNAPAEWEVANAAISRLETVLLPHGIPFGLAVGNHDQTPAYDPQGTTYYYNYYFGESRFAGRAYYGGHYGSDNDNHYDFFSAGGMDFIVIFFEIDQTPDQVILDWADALLATHSERRAIVITHYLMGTGNPGAFSTQGQAIYDALKDRPNLFLMLGGHVHGEGQRTDVYNGSTVHSLLADYQSYPNGGNGYLRILEFAPADDEIRVSTYSPYLNNYLQGSTSQFELDYDMSGTTWTEIGSVNGVPSGGSADLVWSDLASSTEHEWYVTVTDGRATTTGARWRFTTAAASAASGTPPLATTLQAENSGLFRPGSTLAFDLAAAGRVRLQIYGVDGRCVATLVDEELEPGRYTRVWNGADGDGRGSAAGVYFVRLVAPGHEQAQRVVLVR